MNTRSTHCINTATCWRVNGPYRIIYKSRKEHIVGHGSIMQTPALQSAGKIRCIVALNGPKALPQKVFIIDTVHIRKILDGHEQVIWENSE